TGSGIFMTTSGKFEVKAGQHKFSGSQTVTTDLPNLPSSPNGKYILEFDVRHKLDNVALESLPTYSLIDSKGNVRTGSVPKDGIVRVASSDKEEKYTLMVHKYDVEAREEKE
ncbi:type VI secretion system tip protein VgrG, partial [Acinetobacter baumannii]